MAVEFPSKPPATLQDLWLSCQRAFHQLRPGAQAFVLTGVSIGTAVTAVRHGLKVAPSLAFFFDEAGGGVIPPSQISDETFCYFEWGEDVVGKVLVVP